MHVEKKGSNSSNAKQNVCVLNLFILQLYTHTHRLTAENILHEVSYINSTNGNTGLLLEWGWYTRYLASMSSGQQDWSGIFMSSQSMTVDLVQHVSVACIGKNIQTHSIFSWCNVHTVQPITESEHILLHTTLSCVILLNILFRWNDLKTLVPEAKIYRTPVLVPE